MEIKAKPQLLNLLKGVYFKSHAVKAGWPDANKTAIYYNKQYYDQKKKGLEHITEPAGKPVSLALIARTLNFGREPGVTTTGTSYGAIPPRPFMDLAKKNLLAKNKPILKKLITQIIKGKYSEEQLMAFIGQQSADEIKFAMRKGHWAPLSASTIANRRHGGDVPLIDTSTLIDSVSFEIVEK